MKKIIILITCFTFFFQIAIFPAMAQESASNYTPTKEDVLKVLNDSLLDINKSTDEELAASIKSSIDVTEKLEEAGQISSDEATKIKEKFSALQNNPEPKEASKKIILKSLNDMQTLGTGGDMAAAVGVIALGCIVTAFGGLMIRYLDGKSKLIGAGITALGLYIAFSGFAQVGNPFGALTDGLKTP